MFLTVVRFVASSPAGSGGPGARARVLIEMQSVGAHDFCAVTFDAVVEYVAHFFVRMSKVSVTPRTQIVGLWGFCGREKNATVLLLLLSLFCGNPNERAIVALHDYSTYGVQFFRRSPRWTAGRICSPSCSAGRIPTHQDIVSLWLRRLCTRRICHIALGPRTDRSSWGIGIGHLWDDEQNI